ncbi:hypothetical protein CANTEDRAFT_116285 [Yamadazyma tenuis ATCC 10573]|uniref:Uncharacterized protein n=1 Tax=Candida tenuis (strain ATCC 10573 / BCRC 21748 / CBS 615 / JCM 9827 / NBRC 10315 / NRRL Y-1498 / VKM Y-70) TaxID=590646 RepID=G3BCX7_CANTC|nr:uncharacterized protein CANTEDRAFT_116285 [Yamadazyma tenuis ATCC 10573]EGV60232.1 hypothetical protein CANTEDRAFT_116285 [Yamadazyma tenuis ATCC 10573]
MAETVYNWAEECTIRNIGHVEPPYLAKRIDLSLLNSRCQVILDPDFLKSVFPKPFALYHKIFSFS